MKLRLADIICSKKTHISTKFDGRMTNDRRLALDEDLQKTILRECTRRSKLRESAICG